MAPWFGPPTWAMHRPPTMIGEDEVKNLGHAPRKSSLRHSCLPVAAWKQDRMPRTPNVTTFPSATVGELLGPGCELAGPAAGRVAYLSCQSSFPVAASRQRMTSSPP